VVVRAIELIIIGDGSMNSETLNSKVIEII
jgi:hypothetical protein